jgi:hypothetical protein
MVIKPFLTFFIRNLIIHEPQRRSPRWEKLRISFQSQIHKLLRSIMVKIIERHPEMGLHFRFILFYLDSIYIKTEKQVDPNVTIFPIFFITKKILIKFPKIQKLRPILKFQPNLQNQSIKIPLRTPLAPQLVYHSPHYHTGHLGKRSGHYADHSRSEPFV